MKKFKWSKDLPSKGAFTEEEVKEIYASQLNYLWDEFSSEDFETQYHRESAERRACAFHDEAPYPIAREDKHFEQWHYCKKCEQWTRPFKP